MIRIYIQKLISNEKLKESEVETVAREIMSGKVSPVQIASFLTALHMRGESLEDIVAFARIMRTNATPFRRETGPVLDTCGTGGDHSGSFNISTAAALVAAGAGVRVAKHGNRSMTSKCGSADVLIELGVNLDCEPETMERALEEVGICFLYAQKYHTTMQHVAPVRKELGFRTIFNLLGPLANPASASHQLIGVFRPELVEMHARVLAHLGTTHAMVVHGNDGLDEISTTSSTYVAEVIGSDVKTRVIAPQDFDIPPASPPDLVGGDAQTNARIIEDILSGIEGPCLDVVLLNAGAAIYVADEAESIRQGIGKARESIRSGSARRKLDQLRAVTHT